MIINKFDECKYAYKRSYDFIYKNLSFWAIWEDLLENLGTYVFNCRFSR